MRAHMKKVGFSIVVSIFVALVAPTQVGAQTNAMCNTRCQVNEDCPQDYRCYVGVCRNSVCPSSTTCTCSATASPGAFATPVSTPKATVTPSPRATTTPRPTISPAPTASASGTVDQLPNTGFPAWASGALAIGFFVTGVGLANRSILFGSSSAAELAKKRLQKKAS